MEYKLKVLSPLHIGSGEKYNGLNYLLDKRKKPEKVYVLTDDIISETFSEEQLEEFKTWTQKEKYPNLFKFLKYEIKDENFSIHNELQKKARYSLINLSAPEKLREIHSFLKETDSVYIPGGEVKEAIKIAMTYSLLMKDEELYGKLKEEIEAYNEKYKFIISLIKEKANLNKKLNEIIENPEEIPEELQKFSEWKLNKIKNDILNKEIRKLTNSIMKELFASNEQYRQNYDFIEKLTIGNTEIKRPERVLCISNVKITNKTTEFNKYYEFIKSGTELTLKEFKVEDPEKKEDGEEEKSLPMSIKEIFSYCYQFNKDLLEEETSYFKEIEKNDIVEQLNYISSKNTDNAPVIYLGHDKRDLNLALVLAVIRKNPELYDNILIYTNRNYNGKNLMPKSRKIVYYNGQEITAGWVQILDREMKKEKTRKKKEIKTVQGKKKAKPGTLENKLSELARMWNG